MIATLAAIPLLIVVREARRKQGMGSGNQSDQQVPIPQIAVPTPPVR
jgi:hypothetical protein